MLPLRFCAGTQCNSSDCHLAGFDQSQESQNPKVLKVLKHGKYRWFQSCLEFAWFSLAVTCERYISILELRSLRQWRVQSFQTNVAIVSFTAGYSLWLKTCCIQLFHIQIHVRYLFDRRGPQQDSLNIRHSCALSPSHSTSPVFFFSIFSFSLDFVGFLALGTTPAMLHVVNRWFLEDYGIIIQGSLNYPFGGGSNNANVWQMCKISLVKSALFGLAKKYNPCCMIYFFPFNFHRLLADCWSYGKCRDRRSEQLVGFYPGLDLTVAVWKR